MGQTAILHRIFRECGMKISTDSRSVEQGSVFFALKGENFDGNIFVKAALEAGAAYAVAEVLPEGWDENDKRVILVDDTLKALQQLASYHRENTLHNGKRLKILALTGTNGKTTTKELINAVLSTRYRVTATSGNFNNNLGVPLTLLRLTEDTELAVVEMGASHPGDIKELVDIAHPDFGLITNVGRAHLLGFGSFEGVKNTKGELYDYLRGVRGQCFVNADSSDLMEMVDKREGLIVIPYGASCMNVSINPSDAAHPFLSLNFEHEGRQYRVNTNLVGSYNRDNVLAALAVGLEFGVGIQDAVAAIEAYVPNNKRSQLCQGQYNTLIVDAYNANPSSMAAALDNFASIQSGRKALFLGDMLELGAESATEHRKVLDKVESLENVEFVALVGKEFAAADSKGLHHCFATSDEAAAYVSAHPVHDALCLVKGSRGTRMEKILPVL